MSEVFKQARIEGLADMRKVMDELPKRMANKINRGAVWDSARIITTEARELAKARTGKVTGNLVRGITQANKKGKPGTFNVDIGFSRKAFHGHLLEFGTAQRQTKKGANRGIGPAYRFMTDAWYGKREEAAEKLKTALVDRLEKETKKLAKLK